MRQNQKVLAKILTGPALQVAQEDQQEVLEALQQAVTGQGVLSYFLSNDALRGEVGERYSDSVSFKFAFDADGRLLANGLPLQSIAQANEVITALRGAAERKKALTARRAKIRNLQARAMEPVIAKMVARHGLAYKLDERTRSMKLHIRLNDRNALEVTLPYKGAELSQINVLLEGVLQLVQLGVRFRMNEKVLYDQWTKWKEPKLEDFESDEDEDEDEDED